MNVLQQQHDPRHGEGKGDHLKCRQRKVVDKLEQDRGENDNAADDVTGAEKFARDPRQQPAHGDDHSNEEIIQKPRALSVKDMPDAAVIRKQPNAQ